MIYHGFHLRPIRLRRLTNNNYFSKQRIVLWSALKTGCMTTHFYNLIIIINCTIWNLKTKLYADENIFVIKHQTCMDYNRHTIIPSSSKHKTN